MITDQQHLFNWTEARLTDEETVCGLMRAFYAEEQLNFTPESARAAVRTMIGDANLGKIFLLRESLSADARAVGYFVIAYWHSVEFGGRVALLDELYLDPSVRGRKLAPQALAFIREWARAQGATVVRLEVNAHNKRARAIYVKAGFHDDHREIFTQRV